MLLHLIRKLREALRQPRAGRSPRARVRLQVEPLEARNLLDGGFANVLVNDPAADTTALDTQSETAIVLAANGNIVVAFNDTTGPTGPEYRKLTGYSVSTDTGTSFQGQQYLPTNPQNDRGDPVLALSSRTGTVFLATMSQLAAPGNPGAQINVFRSLDDGLTFQAPVNGTPGFVQGVDNADKPWIAVDNFVGPGSGNVYLAWRDFSTNPAQNGIFLSHSTDDGLTWSAAARIADAGAFNVQLANVVVGPDHAVYLFWLDQSKKLPNPITLRVRKSTDQGLTFGDAVVITNVKTQQTNGDLGLTDSTGNSFGTNVCPQASVNPVTGDIYLVYADQPNGSKDKADIFFTLSTDGGKKWSKPACVNDDATINDQWQPALAVTPDGSQVGIFWYDRRLDPADYLIDRYGVVGTVSGHAVSFGPNFRITDVSFPPVFGQDPRPSRTYMGDYDQAVADNSYFYITWGDNRLPNPNYAPHVNQPDVRFAKIPLAGPTAALNAAGAVYGVIANGQGVGTIVDDEPRISISDFSKAEGKKGQTTLFTFTVTLSAAYDQAVTMSFRTVDGTATTSDNDYVAKTGTLTFAPGETTKTVTIEVKGDSKKEADETFYLDLFGNSGNSLFTKSRGIGTILNDD